MLIVLYVSRRSHSWYRAASCCTEWWQVVSFRLQKDGVVMKQTVNTSNLKAWVEPTSPSLRRSRSPSTPRRTQGKSSPISVSSMSPTTTSPPPNWWIQALNLTVEDRDIIHKGAWLNDKIIDVLNKIAADHFHSTPSQTSLLAHDAGGFHSVRRGWQVLYATPLGCYSMRRRRSSDGEQAGRQHIAISR